MKLKAKVWIPGNPIVIGAKQVMELKGKKRRTMLDIKVPQKVLEIDYDKDSQYGWAMGKIKEKVEEATKGKNSFGVLIY